MTDQHTDDEQPGDAERIDGIRAGRRARNQPGGDPASEHPVDEARTARRNRNDR